MSNDIRDCPNRCSAARPSQNPVDADLLQQAGITDDWTNNAMRCGYCDTIYSVDVNGYKTIRGRFGGNTLMTAENWIPRGRSG